MLSKDIQHSTRGFSSLLLCFVLWKDHPKANNTCSIAAYILQNWKHKHFIYSFDVEWQSLALFAAARTFLYFLMIYSRWLSIWYIATFHSSPHFGIELKSCCFIDPVVFFFCFSINVLYTHFLPHPWQGPFSKLLLISTAKKSPDFFIFRHEIY